MLDVVLDIKFKAIRRAKDASKGDRKALHTGYKVERTSHYGRKLRDT